jgi:hypothetical protein
MRIIQVDTANRHEARQYLDLLFTLYRETPQWVPPQSSDASRILDRNRNPSDRHSEAVFFLALQMQSSYNGALGGTVANVPPTEEEVNTLTDQILWFANPCLIKNIWKEADPFGCLVVPQFGP